MFKKTAYLVEVGTPKMIIILKPYISYPSFAQYVVSVVTILNVDLLHRPSLCLMLFPLR